MPAPVPPRWLGWACAAVMFTGMGLFVFGPMLSLAVAYKQLDKQLLPEEKFDEKVRQEKLKEILAVRIERDAWVVPVGLALAASGTMGLLFVFVTRPLGSDLDDEPAAD